MVESNIVATGRSRARILCQMTKIAIAYCYALRVEMLEDRDNVLAGRPERLSRLSRPELRRKRKGPGKVTRSLSQRVDMKKQELIERMIHKQHRAARGDQQFNKVVTCVGIRVGFCMQFLEVRRFQTALAQGLFNRVELQALGMREPRQRIMPGERDTRPCAHHAALLDEQPLSVSDQDRRE